MENTEEKKAPAGKIPVPSEKLKALQAAMDKIEKNYQIHTLFENYY